MRMSVGWSRRGEGGVALRREDKESHRFCLLMITGEPWWRANTQHIAATVQFMAADGGGQGASVGKAEGKGVADKRFWRSDAVRMKRMMRSRGLLFELQAGRALSSLAGDPSGRPSTLATHGGTWNIELRPTSIEEKGRGTGHAYESPAFTLAGDFRFRLIATVSNEIEETSVGLFIRYIGRMVGDDELRVSEDGKVVTELAIPIVRCSARALQQPELPWVSSQAMKFSDPTAFLCGVDHFATLTARDEHVRLEFRVDLLSVHYPGSNEAEELRSKSWETIVQAAEKALTEDVNEPK